MIVPTSLHTLKSREVAWASESKLGHEGGVLVDRIGVLYYFSLCGL